MNVNARAGNVYEAKVDIFNALSTNAIIEAVQQEDRSLLAEYVQKELELANNLEYQVRMYKRELIQMISEMEEEKA